AFSVTNVTTYTALQINVERDDGAVVYLNGVEAGRYNMNPGPVVFSTLALTALDDGNGFFPGSAPASLLVEGTNVLAVEIHQAAANSSDISFDLEMLGIPTIIYTQSPLVTLLSPTNGTYLRAPPSITLAANASDPDGMVAKVEFFADGVKIGETNSSRYTV